MTNINITGNPYSPMFRACLAFPLVLADIPTSEAVYDAAVTCARAHGCAALSSRLNIIARTIARRAAAGGSYDVDNIVADLLD